MAGLTFALGAELEAHDAVTFAARCGAAALTGRGVAPRHVALD
jgi:sugar/nucleoside kinase (ribokinase family)